ncbi:MAG: type II secretion system F family protein [Alphaproteobacteria bacterium]|nr:type II secretion system F family protein [Alphaproteobacteria bacterium]
MEIISQYVTAGMALLTEQFGPLGPLYAVGMLGFLLVLASLPFMMNRKADPVDKLKSNARKEKKQKPTTDGQPALRYKEKGPKLDKYATFLEPQDQEAFSATQLKLIQAGYRQQSSVRTFHFMQMALALGFLLIGIIVVMMTLDTASLQSTLMKIIIPAGVGYYLPTYWVERRRQTRQGLLTEGFPDALDLMLVCVEAGQSLDQSIQRVAEEIHPAFPDLSEEFAMVANEMKAGKDRVSVLRDLGERAGSQDISAFVTVLIQSASFGTSISEALRVYGSEMRDKRVMRAEEKANTLPTKLTLGTMMFTLPPLLIILIGPSIYNIYLTLVLAQQ